jgi:hypothetical protein
MDIKRIFHSFRRWLALLLCSLCFAVSLPSFAQQPLQSTQVYVPLVRERGTAPTVVGIEVHEVAVERDVARLIELGPSWVRRNGLQWAAAEPTEGAGYRWDAPEIVALEQDLLALNQVGTSIVLVVHGSPAWAVAPYNVNCAPIQAAKYSAFATFLAAAVERYSQPPFNVRYWEIGNEPDAPVSPTNSVYGCWGLADDPYYGGGAYGEMLKVVYPAIKAANPNVQVLFGGLLLDRPYNAEDNTGRSSLFLEGALRAGAGAAFDILAFHGYSFYNGTPDGNQPGNWKVTYLRSLLEQFQLSKPLFQSEGALLCVEKTAECHTAQAHALPRMYLRTVRDQLLGFTWYVYGNDSFRHTALIEPGTTNEVRPAFLALRTLRANLQGAQYIGPFMDLPEGAEGYTLTRNTEIISVLWSNTPQTLQLPFAVVQVNCHDWQGTTIACPVQDGQLKLELGPGPLYVHYWPN